MRNKVAGIHTWWWFLTVLLSIVVAVNVTSDGVAPFGAVMIGLVNVVLMLLLYGILLVIWTGARHVLRRAQ